MIGNCSRSHSEPIVELEVKLNVFYSYGKTISVLEITQNFPTFPNILKN